MSALQAVVKEIEAHASAAGWDRPEQLFALVGTVDLVAQEPQLAEALGLTEAAPDSLTPVEQEALPAGRLVEQVLPEIVWPPEVAGVAVVAERLVLPPGVDDDLPEDPVAAQEYAARHPQRQEVRMVAAALRTGESACALRLRSHDQDDLVLTGPDLVPGLLTLLHATLEEETDVG
ncbi:MAG: hypothetical protein J7518_18505 [Nocardioidaceae bacterium]|nr:hypothetical protein [Nocardioidaceae bacterium]